MGQAYNEETFRYFLSVERKRAAQSHRSFLLVLVTLKKPRGTYDRISRIVAAGIFSGLALSVREVDFIGWFRQERVAAAVLTQGADAPASDGLGAIVQRISETLSGHVPADVAQDLQVRVLQLRPRRES